ncbi:MAG: ATP synthase subunit I [Myxococcales bacterium]|nr:ATP synthase subunit I [Myxococcales bacterium]
MNASETTDETKASSSVENAGPARATPPAKRDPALGSSVRATAAAAIVLAVGAAVVVDPWYAVGTLIGGVMATANLVLFIRIVETFIAQSQAGKAVPWAMLWALKLAGLFLCVFVILRRGDVNALAFVMGYGALPIGIAVSSLFGKPPAAPLRADGEPAGTSEKSPPKDE